MTDDIYEPAALVIKGTPLVRPHQHRLHLPSEGKWDQREVENGEIETFWESTLTDGDVYRCTCGDYFRYSEHSMSYYYKYDTPPGTSHWARCDEQGRFYKWTNVAPWWKRMWGITDMRHIIPEEEDND
jgi:hypothetical protein